MATAVTPGGPPEEALSPLAITKCMPQSDFVAALRAQGASAALCEAWPDQITAKDWVSARLVHSLVPAPCCTLED